MNILKHMEAVFLAALVLAISTTYAFDATAPAKQQTAPAVMASAAPVAVVVVSAKRLSTHEKSRQAMRGGDNHRG